jgi:glycosyltransferase involved in cell wall biosynthesis
MGAGVSMADLTLVLAARDAEATLARTLESLVPVMEAGAACILVEDGSTDGTGALMAGFAGRWPRVRHAALPDAVGVGAARNIGLDLVETRFVGMIDGDDWVDPAYFPALVARFARHPDLDFLRSHYTECTGPVREIRRAPFEVTERPFDPRLGILPIQRPTLVDHPQIWAGLYDSDFLQRNGVRYASLRTAEDRIFAWKLQVLGRSCLVAEEHRIFYRRGNAGSLTRTGDDRQLDFLPACEEVLAFLMEGGHELFLPKAVRQTLALIVFHRDHAARLLPDVRQRLDSRAAMLLRLLPEALLDQGMADLDDRRRNLIAEIV